MITPFALETAHEVTLASRVLVCASFQDSTGISNLFVLDLCDTANTQDPRDGRTSLMTAVLDNNEVLQKSWI